MVLVSHITRDLASKDEKVQGKKKVFGGWGWVYIENLRLEENR